MKKHLIAAAVVGAFAAPAMAQNVSVYGVMDTGLQSFDSGAAANSQSTRAVDGGLATSRLGFIGTEDLGGGMKASFKLEARLNPSAASNGGALFNRGANISLSGGFGAVTLGYNDTTGGQDIDSAVSQAGNLALRPTLLVGAYTGSGEIGSDVAQVVRYTSPTFNGFTAELGYTLNTTSAATDAGTSTTDVYVKYVNGPLGIHFSNAQTAAATAVAETDFRAIGISYNAGFASFGLSTSKGDYSATDSASIKTTIASVKVPLAGGLAAHGVIGNAKSDSASNAKGSGYTFALTKALSKRTTVYGAYTSTESEAGAQFAMTGVTATNVSGYAAGQDMSAVTIGISHSF
jgi:predicted porin